MNWPSDTPSYAPNINICIYLYKKTGHARPANMQSIKQNGKRPTSGLKV